MFSGLAACACSTRWRNSVAHACTGGLTSLKFHSYAGICPFGCRYVSPQHQLELLACAKSGSTVDSATQWNARSQAAYHGYSHLSGIEITWSLTMWNHSRLRTRACCPTQRVRVVLLEPAVDVEVVVLLGPEHAGERLAHDARLVGGRRWRRDRARRTRRPRACARRRRRRTPRRTALAPLGDASREAQANRPRSARRPTLSIVVRGGLGAACRRGFTASRRPCTT